MDKLQQMRAFAAVVDAGSFVGGAEALGASKAAVSRQVSDLEARLAVRLLHRTTRRISLTEEGEVFHARCRVLLAEIEEAEAEVSMRSGEATGLVRVNVPVTFGILHLAGLWGAFRDAHPKVTLEIVLADRMVDLVDEGYDLAVRIGRLSSSTLVSRRLSATRLVLCASPSYLERAGMPTHPSELARHAVLAYSYHSMGDAWAFEGPEGPVTVRIDPCVRTNNGDTCRVGALQHQGIVLQPTFLVGEDLRAGRLVELMPKYRSIELGVHAVYPSRRHLPPKVRLLVEFLARSFRRPPWPA